MARIVKCPEDKRKERPKFSAENSGCSHHTQQAGNLVHPIDTSPSKVTPFFLPSALGSWLLRKEA